MPSKYTITRFKLEDIDKMNVRKEHKAEALFIRDNVTYHDIYLNGFPFYTLQYENVPILIYGFHNSGVGTYSPLVLVAEEISSHKFAVIRALFKYAVEVIGSDCRRLEAYVKVEDAPAKRLAEMFGFEMIGLRRNSTLEGGDEIIYERLQFGRVTNGSK